MKEETFSSIKFEEVAFPRYVKVKESIESLTRIIDFEQTKQDGIDRVLHALLQLIDENDDKTVEEKREIIEDAIYNGNVFRHYFSEENQAKAVDVLSKTSLLNDEERLIYIINFYMPNDVNFSSIYSKSDKNIDKIADHYDLTNSDSSNLVYARVAEISKFYKLYQEEKERQKIQTLAAMQDATEEPSLENIEKVRTLLGNLADANLRETLEQQLVTLEQGELVPEMLEESSEIEELLVPEELGEEVVIEEEPVATTEEDLEATEPALLEDVLGEEQSDKKVSDGNVGKDVMASLQTLVANARNNAQRVEQLSLDLGIKDEQIAELQATVNAKDQELAGKNQALEAKEAELQERDKRLEEQNSQLVLLRSEVEAKDVALAEASRTIASKDEEIASLTTSLSSYKTSLGEIQNFLSSAQYGVGIEENPRKVA